MNCPRCIMRDGETIQMQPKTPDYFVCPKCGGEFWPRIMGEAEETMETEQEGESGYISMSWQPGERVQGGGGSTGHVKKKHRKKSLGAINATLSADFHNH